MVDDQKDNTRVLIVDDNEKNLKILSVILRKTSYQVSEARDGLQAIEIANKIVPDIILLDVMMPELNGYETCERIKADARTKDAPIIFISANIATEDVLKGFEAGGADYVTKPFNSAILLAKIKTHLELAQKTKQLQTLAEKDGLTQLANRRKFDEFIAEEWRRCLRDNAPIAAIMIDIDHFKLYNDTYGHQQGDAALKKVAGVIGEVCRRPGDLAARYGGEEFAAILSGTDIETASNIAEKICRITEQLCIPHKTSKVKDTVTISVGVAATVPNNESQPEQLIKMADKQLYEAKTTGRNQVKS